MRHFPDVTEPESHVVLRRPWEGLIQESVRPTYGVITINQTLSVCVENFNRSQITKVFARLH